MFRALIHNFGTLVLLLTIACGAKDALPPAAVTGAGAGTDAAGAAAGSSSDQAGAPSRPPVQVAGRGSETAAAGSGGNAVAGGGAAGRAPAPPKAGMDAGPSTEPVMLGKAETTVILATKLAQPSDLAFNPYVAGELWVTNFADSSAVIISDAPSESRSSERRLDPEGNSHFMPMPKGLAFGGRETTVVDAAGKKVEGTFATCPAKDEDYMGPTLWTSDLRIFAIAKPDREPPFNGSNTGKEGPGSHLDMLHRTPTCTGIAWEGTGNVYWTYSGKLAMFVKYDFALDHGIGNDDHSDGSEWRYAVKGMGYVPALPSHLEYDATRKLVYMADTGNARVVAFDPASVTSSQKMTEAENADHLAVAMNMIGGELRDLIPASAGLKKPVGLAIRADKLYVSDNETSTIHRFTLDGAAQGSIVIEDVKTGGLTGLAFGPDEKLYVGDMVGNRVLRLENAL